MTSITESVSTEGEGPFARSRARIRHFIRAVAGAGLAIFALAFLFAAEPAGTAVRGDLGAAASRLGAIPFNARLDRVRAALKPEFPDLSVTVDPGRFPVAVAVTVHGLDRDTCVAAEQGVRRIEGKVVVELEGYGSSELCGARNDMTWRLMP